MSISLVKLNSELLVSRIDQHFDVLLLESESLQALLHNLYVFKCLIDVAEAFSSDFAQISVLAASDYDGLLPSWILETVFYSGATYIFTCDRFAVVKLCLSFDHYCFNQLLMNF